MLRVRLLRVMVLRVRVVRGRVVRMGGGAEMSTNDYKTLTRGYI